MPSPENDELSFLPVLGSPTSGSSPTNEHASGQLSKTSSSVSVALSQARMRRKLRLKKTPTSSFAPAAGLGGERFAETSGTRDLRMVPGPGEYHTEPSMGRQVSSLHRNHRVTTFAAPSIVDALPNAPAETFDDLRRKAQQRIGHKLSSGANAIECLARMWDSNRDGKLCREELGRGLQSLGLSLTEYELNLLFDLYDISGDGGIDLNELRAAVKEGALPWNIITQDHLSMHEHSPSPHQQHDQVLTVLAHMHGARSRSSFGGQPDAQFRDQHHIRMAAPNASPPKRVSPRRKAHVIGNWQFSSADSTKPEQEQLRSLLTRRAVRVIDLFRAWDTSIDGQISRAEFEAGVRRLGLRALDSESINALFDSWDTDGSGYLSLLEFNSILRRGGYPRLSTHARIDVIDSEPGLSELEESNHKLSERAFRVHRTFTNSVGTMHRGANDRADRSLNRDQEDLLRRLSHQREEIVQLLKSWEADRHQCHGTPSPPDGGGFMRRRDLHRILPSFGIVADKATTDDLFLTMDYTRTGRVPIPHFDKALRWISGSKRSKVLKINLKPDIPIHEQLTDFLMAHSMRIIDLFKKWDDDGDGEITRHEFMKALPMVGISPSQEELDRVFDAFDADGSGTISFKEFFHMLKRGETAKQYEEKKRAAARALREAREAMEDVVPLEKLKKEVMRECQRLKPPRDMAAAVLAGLNITSSLTTQ